MANFVETATLRLKDQTSANARKITASLRAMEKEMARLNNLSKKPIKLLVNTNDLGKAIRQMNTFHQAMRRPLPQRLVIKTSNADLERTKRKLIEIDRQISRINSRTAHIHGSVIGSQARPYPYPAGGGVSVHGNRVSLDISPLVSIHAPPIKGVILAMLQLNKPVRSLLMFLPGFCYPNVQNIIFLSRQIDCINIHPIVIMKIYGVT